MSFKFKRWGWYLVLCEGRYFKLKILYFKKNGEISRQQHAWRDEVWCFVYGSGWFETYQNCGCRQRKYIQGGESEYVPKRRWHHYKANKPTLAIELQTGICKEEDIFRDE